MEQKKELILRVLEKLEWYWDMAWDFIILIRSTYCTNEVIDSLIKLIYKSMKTIQKNNEKELVQKTLEKIQKIRQLEKEAEISDEELDVLLDNI